jgi:gliding motility-associated-like protein
MMKTALKIWLFFALLMSGGTVVAQPIIDTACRFTKSQVYRVTPQPGFKYFWSVECGKIVSSRTADSVVIDWCGTPGDYTITCLQVNEFGCAGDTVKARVLIDPDVKIGITGTSDICRGDYVTLFASGADRYKWSTGDTTPSITIRPDNSTRYHVTGWSRCMMDTASFHVRVYGKPVANFYYLPDTPFIHQPVRFVWKGNDADSVYWYFIDSGSNIVTDPPDYTFKRPGKQSVTIVVTNKGGCADTAKYSIFVEDDARIYVPNVFTPDGNRRNEIFVPVTYGIEKLHLEVFNRWGEKLFETDELGKGWDGIFKDELVQEGAYVWMIKAKGKNLRSYYLSGTVTVLY